MPTDWASSPEEGRPALAVADLRGGGSVTTLASGTSGYGIAVDSTSVYWTNVGTFSNTSTEAGWAVGPVFQKRWK